MTSSTTTSAAPTLTPQGGGTPLGNLLHCCLPKQSPPPVEVPEKARDVGVPDEGETKENAAVTTVDEPKALDSEEISDPPNLDEEAEAKQPLEAVATGGQSRVTPNALLQFWQFIFSILFLQFLHSKSSSSTSNKRKKAISNESAATTEPLTTA